MRRVTGRFDNVRGVTGTDSFPYPQGSVVGVFADDTTVEDARRRLEQSGFGADRYEVLHGEQGLARIDVDGAAHGRSGSIKRRLQSVFSDDADQARRYADDLRDGHYIVGVVVGEDEAAKRQAADALRGAHADSLAYYAKNYVEDLA